MPDWGAPYLALYRSGELANRVKLAMDLLRQRCRVCPRHCKVDRLEDEVGPSGVGRDAVVASHFPHFGEEDCLRGQKGSGRIFFSGCNPRCVFCQNNDLASRVSVSRRRRSGSPR
jgi:putative pyruvate formate lyase activating enzyme